MKFGMNVVPLANTRTAFFLLISYSQ